MLQNPPPPWVRAAMLAVLIGLAPATAGAQVEKALDTVEQTNRQDASSQNKIDRLSEQTRRMLEQYREAIRKTQQLQVYNRELEQIVAEQQARKTSLTQRVEGVAGLRDEIEPLMLRMIDSLKRFVAADLPFLVSEREQRISELRTAVADPETGVAEKFRRVLAAYQTEAEYGRTMGTYRGELSFDNQQRLVEFLRVGRTMLFYITPDDANVGYWDRDAGHWKPLPASYRTSIRQGIKVAKDLAAPQLIEIAVPSPTRAKAQEQAGDSGGDS